MVLNHLLQHTPLNDDLAGLEQILDIDIVVLECSTLPGDLLHGLVKLFSSVASHEKGSARCLAEVERLQHAGHVSLEIGLSQTVLQVLVRHQVEIRRHAQLHAILAHNQLALPVSVAQRRSPRLVVDLAVELGAEVAGVRTESLSTAAQDGTLPGAHAGATGTLLGSHLAVRAVDVVASLAGGGALACGVALVDDGVVEDVAAEGEEEVVDGPLLEGCWLQVGEAVDGERDGRD